MKRTEIEYLTHTWNPIAMRCTKISPACDNCWHLRMADRLAETPFIPLVKKEAYAGGKVYLDEKELKAPLKVKKPAVIGLQFMGDLFHQGIEWPIIDEILFIARRSCQHTIIILTKRIETALYYFRSPIFKFGNVSRSTFLENNIWLGVTVENQEQADKRIPMLLQIPAAHRFVSVEPMLEPVDLDKWFYSGDCKDWCPKGNDCYECTPGFSNMFKRDGSLLNWVICGCESGPKRRPTDIKAIRSLRDQCVESNTPFFLKQMDINGKVVSMPELDGKVWDQLPWDNI